MDRVDYKQYLQSPEWKEKRFEFLFKDDVSCYCCKAEKWKYRIYKCKGCGHKFIGDKWDYEPHCDCGSNPGFLTITDGSEFFQLHHLTYKNLGNEGKEDLIVLCEDCHRLVHDLIRSCHLKIDNAPDFIKYQKSRQALEIERYI